MDNMMQAHEPFDSSVIEEPLLRQLYGYWKSKHKNERLPRRDDIYPAEIHNCLPNILLADTA